MKHSKPKKTNIKRKRSNIYKRNKVLITSTKTDQFKEYVIRHISSRPAFGPGGGVAVNDGWHRNLQCVQHGLIWRVGQVHQHTQPVHFQHNFLWLLYERVRLKINLLYFIINKYKRLNFLFMCIMNFLSGMKLMIIVNIYLTFVKIFIKIVYMAEKVICL